MAKVTFAARTMWRCVNWRVQSGHETVDEPRAAFSAAVGNRPTSDAVEEDLDPSLRAPALSGIGAVLFHATGKCAHAEPETDIRPWN
jgi:hypothetical protein